MERRTAARVMQTCTPRVIQNAGGKISSLMVMNGRHWALALCIVLVAVVAVLASSLHDVHFQPGRSIAVEAPSESAPPLNLAEIVSQTPLWKVLLFWLAFVVNLILFFYLIPRELRKRILRQMLSLALGSLAILMALRYRLIELPFLKTDPVTQTIGSPSGIAASELPPAFQPPRMTPWLTFLISFAVLCAVLLSLWVAYRWWMRSSRRRFSELDTIGAIAQSSLGELASGHDWSDVIIRSYARMSEAVSARRGLQRARAATPREFAERLEQAGLPAHAVERLTRLFESVRYGARASSQSDVKEAMACLQSILQSCGLAE
jgi:hypothetical protein